MMPQLPLAEYHFSFQMADDLRMQGYPGSLWHGVFGKTLRESVCFAKEAECKTCLMLHSCDYSRLFSAPKPDDSELMRHYQAVPVPHVFRCGDFQGLERRAGQALEVSLVLVGDANDSLGLVIEVLKRAGLNGLGKKRSKARLQQVLRSPPVSGQALEQVIEPAQTLKPLAVNPLVALPPMPEKVRLQFLTPCRQNGLKRGDKLQPARLLMAIVRRVSLLQYFYTGQMLETDFRLLKSLSEMLVIGGQNLHYQPCRRYSARRGDTLDSGGFVGHLDLVLGDALSLWPFLYLGQWLNVGKNASMGFGQYRLYLL